LLLIAIAEGYKIGLNPKNRVAPEPLLGGIANPPNTRAGRAFQPDTSYTIG